MDALDHAGCLVVTGMFDHEMHESAEGELASHMAAAAVADGPARALPNPGATGSFVGADQACRRKP